MNKYFIEALNEIEKERGIDKNEVIETLEKALEKSYEENYKSKNVEITIDKETGDVRVFSIFDVVDDVTDKTTQKSLEEAKSFNKRAKVGGVIKVKVTPKDFDRVAAKRARDMVIQFMRSAERQSVYDEYIDRKKEIIVGTVQRVDSKNLLIDLGKSDAFLPKIEQVEGEVFEQGDRIKVYIKDVKSLPKGTQIVLSRRDPELVTKLFEDEVPEIKQGIVEIRSVSREAGNRTKIAVYAEDANVDPVGACVGVRGSRVNAIVEEINGEKIDIIVWSKDMKVYISNSLSPAEVVDVYINEKENFATAFVPDSQLSLAIGKEGQNVRLAANLTEWKIDIKPESIMKEVLEELKSKEEINESEKLDDNNDLDLSSLENIIKNNSFDEEN